MRFILIVFLLFSLYSSGQNLEPIVSKLKPTQTVPANLLAARSVVLYDYGYTAEERETIQKSFQQTGIDAVVYFVDDLILSGKEVAPVFVKYFNEREIKFLIILDKKEATYTITITPFNSATSFVEAGQDAWQMQHNNLKEMLGFIYGTALNNQKKNNFLINDIPEQGKIPALIAGRRAEYFTLDLAVDMLAVPKSGNEQMDRELEEFFKANYPFQYQLTEPNANEKDLRKQGLHYMLCQVHTRNAAAREILGYDMSKAESAMASVTYPNGAMQLKAISAETTVYKFYFRHIDSGNVYLGTKWDADVTWQEALRNHIKAFRGEVKK